MTKYKQPFEGGLAEPSRGLDDQLAFLKDSVHAAGGEDSELWEAVELHGGVIYNQWDNMQRPDRLYQYFAFSNAKRHMQSQSYMTKVYDTWQEAAKDWLVFATFGVRKSGADKS